MTEIGKTDRLVVSDRYPLNNGLKSSEDRKPETHKLPTGAKYRKVKPKNEKSRKIDDALSELEEIYASLNLDDEDLLDRAERRDLPSKFQLMRLNSKVIDSSFDIIKGSKHCNLIPGNQKESPQLHPVPIENSNFPLETGWAHPFCDEFFQSRDRHQNLGFVDSLLASSDPPYRYKAPARRRSAIPDPVNDDLAARKMVKNRSEATDKSNGGKKIQSYLLLSPIYCPSNGNCASPDFVASENYLSSEPKPDIEKDDLSYRRFIQSDAATVTPAHPPFGIPIGPTDLTTLNNYVQASLSEQDRNFFYYRVKPYYPHLIKDDMAFRSFRKDLDKSQDKSRKSWVNGIKLVPVTTQHLINQRNEARMRPSSADPIGHNQHRFQQPHRQYPIQSFISSSFENLSSSFV